VKLIGQTIKPNLPWHVLTNAICNISKQLQKLEVVENITTMQKYKNYLKHENLLIKFQTIYGCKITAVEFAMHW